MNTHTTSPNMLIINNIPHPVFPGTILPHWTITAATKGFDFVDRIVDRLHFALKCQQCGNLNKVNRYTLMSAQPLCRACIERAWTADATAAGLTFLRRDPTNRHYGIYLADCGHEVRRQFEMIKRIAAGLTGFRCETCHAVTEASEAEARDWTLIGPDPEGDPNYRIYRHDDCGHVQRISRRNLQADQFSCSNCSEDWPAAPSYVYAMSFTLASGREVVKLGFSRHPESRMNYQLKLDAQMPCQVLRVVSMPTGHAALCAEKAMHKRLKKAHPAAAVDPSAWRSQIRVKTEIYDGALTPVILGMLDALEAKLTTA